MRYNTNSKKTAKYIVNKYMEADLEKIFLEYGEERFSKIIARKICLARKTEPIKTTFDLVAIIKRSIPSKFLHSKTHYATKIFQALRIEVNDELNNIAFVLDKLINILEKDGVLAIISFHSLEDRIVKQFFVRESKGCICPPLVPICKCDHKPRIRIITKKPIVPTIKEVNSNPRARSAKLRVIVKI